MMKLSEKSPEIDNLNKYYKASFRRIISIITRVCSLNDRSIFLPLGDLISNLRCEINVVGSCNATFPFTNPLGSKRNDYICISPKLLLYNNNNKGATFSFFFFLNEETKSKVHLAPKINLLLS